MPEPRPDVFDELCPPYSTIVAISHTPTTLAERLAAAEALLGDLIDTLSDELRLEVMGSGTVIDRIENACRHLGGNYMGYVGSWV